MRIQKYSSLSEICVGRLRAGRGERETEWRDGRRKGAESEESQRSQTALWENVRRASKVRLYHGKM